MTTGDRVYWMWGTLQTGRLITTEAGMAAVAVGTTIFVEIAFVPASTLRTSSIAALQSVEPSPSVIVEDNPVPAPTRWARSSAQCAHASTLVLEGEGGWTCTVCGHVEYFA